MRKSILEKRLGKLNEKREQLKAKGLASEDVNEVRAINAQLEDLNDEISFITEELQAINEERSVPADAKLVNGEVKASFVKKEKRENVLESMEYRQSFMNYVQRGDAISTGDTAPAIPLTIMNEVINTVRKRYGNLYNKVTKTNMAGGVEYPIGALKATFKWITESTVSPRQKVDALAKVSFGYHQAEIRIAQTFLSTILTLPAHLFWHFDIQNQKNTLH